MHEALRPMLMGIVLINLIFVHITGAVSLTWLLPLYGLTLAGPLFTQFHDRLSYRMAWNVAVLGIFAVLANHATRSGVTYLLEDGLILAALCQVHLYNNLRKNQKPDLLFFNSFLIAFVTSFFCQDLIYCVVFVAYVLWIIPTVQVWVAMDPAEKRNDLVRQVVRDSVPRSLLALAITALVFFFWPRDFYREGWVSENVYSPVAQELTVGFSDEVRLGRYGKTSFNHEEVLRVGIDRETAQVVPTHWRGATFLHYGPSGWFAERQLQHPSRPNVDHRWELEGLGTWTRDGHGPTTRLHVKLLDQSDKRIFLPLGAAMFQLTSPPTPEHVSPLIDGTVAYLGPNLGTGRNRALFYEVGLSQTLEAPALSPAQLRQLVSLDRRTVPQIAYDLARSLRTRLPAASTDRQIVEAFRAHLSQGYDYLLPGAKGAASGLNEFLRGGRGGHCEYFATALALLLRTQKIPCRLVTGFLADEWDDNRSALIIRHSDAHAWVEVYDKDTGWYVADPSPARGDEAVEAEGVWSSIRQTFDDLWATVTGFDSDAHRRAWKWLRRSPQNLALWIGTNPWTAACLALLIGALIYSRRHLARNRIPVSILAYRATLRRARLSLEPGETPRELVARALRSEHGDAASVQLLIAATRAHEVHRYAGRVRPETIGRR